MGRTTTFAIVALLLCAVAIPAQATIINVTNTNDSGSGSLRQALADANDGDTVTFAVTGTIGLNSGELVVDKSVQIRGPGPDMLAVSRSSNTYFRIFHVMPGLTVTIAGLTISNGYAQFDIAGGTLNDHATLTLTNCTITANEGNDGGGGIYNNGGTLTIVDSTVNGNSSSGGDVGFGGGIYIYGGSVTIIHSTVSGNSAVGQFPYELGAGGGILSGGTLTITGSTIAGNYSGFSGGGIDGTVTISNSTISGNGAGGGKNNMPGLGGGIDGGGTISNCTISGNSVFGSAFKGPGLGAGIYAGGATISNSTLSDNIVLFYGNGGAIYNGGTLTIDNNTLSNNSATQGGGIYNGGSIGIGNTILNRGNASGESIFNNGGTITSAGYNISSDDGGGYLNGPGDQINTDPLLGPLQDNGGPTFTHELLPGSPAIDAGEPNFVPPPFYDQRGAPFVRVFNGRIDIGSFEVQPTPTPRATPTPRPRHTPLPRP